MQLPVSVDVLKYRSIEDKFQIPFQNKSTFVIGPNNSGKSNILKCIASIFNTEYTSGDVNHNFRIRIKKDGDDKLDILNRLHLKGNEEIELIFKNGHFKYENVPTAIYDYAKNDGIVERFGGYQNEEEIIEEIYRSVLSEVETHFRGSVYVPNIRYITPTGKEPEFFSNTQISGTKIKFGDIIESLTKFGRPDTSSRIEFRKRLKNIEDFIAFCVDKAKVKIEVPHDKKTIHVDIDGEEHPIHDLGTGIEQLLIIGFSSFSFPNKIVLIDEPELHFHPRAQKRMVQYLNDNVDAHFVFATHSAAVLDAVEADIIQVAHDGKKSLVNTVLTNKDRYQAVRDLGHSPSDLLLTRYTIWVEGPSDRIYLNHWIKKVDPSLKEGIDYTILFYGGKILSHHSFDEVENELVKAFSLCREFALLMDSDIHEKRSEINATKQRIKDEVETENGFCWITDGREVENYLPDSIISSLKEEFKANLPSSKKDQIITEKKTNFAKAAVKLLDDLADDDYVWPLDLKAKVLELVQRIRSAK